MYSELFSLLRQVNFSNKILLLHLEERFFAQRKLLLSSNVRQKAVVLTRQLTHGRQNNIAWLLLVSCKAERFDRCLWLFEYVCWNFEPLCCDRPSLLEFWHISDVLRDKLIQILLGRFNLRYFAIIMPVKDVQEIDYWPRTS